MATIVTNCSKRKRLAPDASLVARSLAPGSLDAVSNEWAGRLRASQPRVEACKLYAGRQHSEALRASLRLDAHFLIVSAGLGMVRSSEPVPSYSLTVAPGGSDSVLEKVQCKVTSADWWRAITKPESRCRSLAATLEQIEDERGLILIALPSPYLEMLKDELAQFPPDRIARTRVFTGPSFRFHDARLDGLRMPYDARLDGPESPSPGTATDFASRALRDFAEVVLPNMPDEGCQEHAAAVFRRLAGWTAAARPERARQSDCQLKDIIRANWRQAGGSASQMLRWVRGELGMACEQGRMKDLYAAIQSEMENAA
jgi:hypothetical protein